jgi:hypothetical protein
MATAKTAAAAKAPEYRYTPSRKRASHRQIDADPRRAGVRAYTGHKMPRVGPEAFVPSQAGAIAAKRPARQPEPAEKAKGDFVDFLLRGRGWIVVIALLLGGIVFLNVSALQQERQITASTEHANQLQQQNAQLRLTAGDLASSDRIQQVASGLGYTMPAPGAVHYVQSDPGSDIRGASAALNHPPQQDQQQRPGGPGKRDDTGHAPKQHLANNKNPLAGDG